MSNSCNPVDCSHQAPLSMDFSRQEYWSGLSFPSPGDLPNPGTEPRSSTLQADSLPNEPLGEPKNIFGVGANGRVHPFHLLAPLQNDLLGHALLFTHCLCFATTGCFRDLSDLACLSRILHPLPPALPQSFALSKRYQPSASCWG